MKYLRDLVKENGHKIRHFSEGAEKGHKYMRVFDYSEKHGGTYDSFKYYNDYVIDLGEISMLDNLDDILRTFNGDRNPFDVNDDKELSKDGIIGYNNLRQLLRTLTEWGVIANGWEDRLDKELNKILKGM